MLIWFFVDVVQMMCTRAGSLSYRWRTGVPLTQGIEKILRRQTLHVGLPIGSNSLRGPHVALAAALDLVDNYTSNDDEEDAAKSTAE